MATFVGIISGPEGPLGQIKLSLAPEAEGRRIVTGSVKAGEDPPGFAGFSGAWDPNGTFLATGADRLRNDYDNPLDDVYLEIKVSGQASGEQATGNIAATVNGHGQPGWSFEAWDIYTDKGKELLAAGRDGGFPGGELLQRPIEAITDVATDAGTAIQSAWDWIPTIGKVAGGVLLTIYAVNKLR